MLERMKNGHGSFISQLNRRTRYINRHTDHSHDQRSMINHMIRIRAAIRTFYGNHARQNGTRQQQMSIRYSQFQLLMRNSRLINRTLQAKRTQVARQVIRRILVTSFNTTHNHVFTRLTGCKFSTRRNFMDFISRKRPPHHSFVSHFHAFTLPHAFTYSRVYTKRSTRGTTVSFLPPSYRDQLSVIA